MQDVVGTWRHLTRFAPRTKVLVTLFTHILVDRAGREGHSSSQCRAGTKSGSGALAPEGKFDLATMKSVCVYCGSRTGDDPAHRALAEELGTILGQRGILLVYGGGRVGLMGVVADAVLAAGGDVEGVIPEALHASEVGHDGVGTLHIVDSMSERKAKMFALADGFVALPGGTGTLDEVIDILTWRQLKFHTKPLVLLDQAYWTPFIDLLAHTDAKGFGHGESSEQYSVVDTANAALTTLEAAPPGITKVPLDSL
jgi:uncharacterized protein (TIGR00730 family)